MVVIVTLNTLLFSDLNLLSWGCNNVLAVALGQAVYMWDAASGEIKELMAVENDDYVSSVAFLPSAASHVAIGTASNTVQLWDVQAQKQVRVMEGHSSRVGALAWNNHILSSGSNDTTIINHDVRIANHAVGRMTQHSQEVCGLAWSPDGTMLASGANDNTLCLTEAANMHTQNCTARYALTDHQAAVKALAWSPHERNLLASGGGTADRCIKFWNSASGSLLNSVDTGSQVCALQWSPHEKELLSRYVSVSFLSFCLFADCEVQPRLRGEPVVSVEVPVDGAHQGVQGTLCSRAAHGHLAGRLHGVLRLRRRDPALLEHIRIGGQEAQRGQSCCSCRNQWHQ